jgi:hypothetical protein
MIIQQIYKKYTINTKHKDILRMIFYLSSTNRIIKKFTAIKKERNSIL